MGKTTDQVAFTVRIDKTLKARVETARAADGRRNLNSWVIKAVQEKLQRDERRAP